MQNTRRQEDLTGETLLEANNQEVGEHDSKDHTKNIQLNNSSPTKSVIEVDKSFYVGSLDYVNLSQDDLPVTVTVEESSKNWKEEMVPGHAPRSPGKQCALKEPTANDAERDDHEDLSASSQDDKEDVMRIGDVAVDVNKIRESKLMVPLPNCSGDTGDVLRDESDSEGVEWIEDSEPTGTGGKHQSIDDGHMDEEVRSVEEPSLECTRVERDHIPSVSPAPLVIKPSNGEVKKGLDLPTERLSTNLLVPESPIAGDAMGGGSLVEVVDSYGPCASKVDNPTSVAGAPPVIQVNKKRARAKEKALPWLDSEEEEEGLPSFISVFSSYVGPPIEVFPDVSLEAKDDECNCVDSETVYVIPRPLTMRYADAAVVFVQPQRFSEEYRQGLVL